MINYWKGKRCRKTQRENADGDMVGKVDDKFRLSSRQIRWELFMLANVIGWLAQKVMQDQDNPLWNICHGIV